MRKTMMTAAVMALALTGVAQAQDAPAPTARDTAAKLCRAERGTSDATRAAFAKKYGTNKNKKNAFGKCVSKLAAQQVAKADTAKKDAAAACTTERGATAETQAAFAQKYGTNKNGKNAFGKCVSQQAAEAVAAASSAEVSAAKACATERGGTAASRAAFTQKYGTNKNKNNAFGKCVSQKAKA